MTSARYRVIVGNKSLHISGIGVFSVRLVEGLVKAGIDAECLVTKPELDNQIIPLAVPETVRVVKLPIHKKYNYKKRWKALIEYLEAAAPCIYIPNHDYQHSVVSAALSNRVAVVGVVHGDHADQYDQISRLGRYWNEIVCVSQKIKETICTQQPELIPRVSLIHNGVPIPQDCPERGGGERPLRIVYVGRISDKEKRILDMIEIIRRLEQRGISVKLDIVGEGPDRELAARAAGSMVSSGTVAFPGSRQGERLLKMYEDYDVFLLTSLYEGMPLSLLEAMGRGCVPVASAIASGIPELIRDGENGFIVEQGDIAGFVERISTLRGDADLTRRMSRAAFRLVKDGGFTAEEMVGKYVRLFEQVVDEMERGLFKRPQGRIRMPSGFKKSLYQRAALHTNRLFGIPRIAGRA